jgi:hypothetical protein
MARPQKKQNARLHRRKPQGYRRCMTRDSELAKAVYGSSIAAASASA